MCGLFKSRRQEQQLHENMHSTSAKRKSDKRTSMTRQPKQLLADVLCMFSCNLLADVLCMFSCKFVADVLCMFSCNLLVDVLCMFSCRFRLLLCIYRCMHTCFRSQFTIHLRLPLRDVPLLIGGDCAAYSKADGKNSSAWVVCSDGVR